MLIIAIIQRICTLATTQPSSLPYCNITKHRKSIKITSHTIQTHENALYFGSHRRKCWLAGEEKRLTSYKSCRITIRKKKKVQDVENVFDVTFPIPMSITRFSVNTAIYSHTITKDEMKTAFLKPFFKKISVQTKNIYNWKNFFLSFKSVSIFQ